MGQATEIAIERIADVMAALDARGGGESLSTLPDKLSILLVEDDEADAYLVHRALQNHPRVRNIVRAHDGVEALELLDDGAIKPDLAIIDLRMPRKDGFALLREIDLRDDVDFPSIVLTSSRAGADAYRSRKRGASLFISKPNAADKFATVLENAIAAL